MLGWFRPFSTSISPQTLDSLPLTFFFGITLSATIFVIRSLESDLALVGSGGGVRGSLGVEGREDRISSRSFAERCRWIDAGGLTGPESAAAPCSATASCSGGTCHVAFYLIGKAHGDPKERESRNSRMKKRGCIRSR